jgi:hypothetical protein
MAAQLPECLSLSRRLTARQADAEARNSTVATKVGLMAHRPEHIAPDVAHCAC